MKYSRRIALIVMYKTAKTQVYIGWFAQKFTLFYIWLQLLSYLFAKCILIAFPNSNHNSKLKIFPTQSCKEITKFILQIHTLTNNSLARKLFPIQSSLNFINEIAVGGWVARQLKLRNTARSTEGN